MSVPLFIPKTHSPILAASSRLLFCHRPYSQAAKEPEVEVLQNSGRRGKKKNEVTLKSDSVISTVIPSVTKSLLGGRSSAPMNWNYPNKKLDDDYKEEAPLDEIIKDIPKLSKHQWKLLKTEVKETFENPLEKPDCLIAMEGSKHNEAMIQYDFKTDESLALWHLGSDSMWGQGYSKCKLVRTNEGTGVFRGFLNTEVVKDGKTERAGWASIKTLDQLAFKRKRKLWWFRNYSHLLIKCRGDGRSYKVMLYVPGAIDLTWGDTYSYPLHTHGGPYWQYAKLPFSRFLHTVGGRIQDNQRRVSEDEISAISIVIMDRIDGPFNLEIDYIGAYNDSSHEEHFAYETYSIPMFNPQTI